MNSIQQQQQLLLQDIPIRTLAQIDEEFEQLGCLGHGGAASVFLARKRSGRCVALKMTTLDSSSDDDMRDWMREVHAVTKLNKTNNNKQDSRDLAIVFFEEWFVGRNFACIVMSYMNGGTLADEIVSHTLSFKPFTERRIGWYALQLSEALAYAHERGVAHHDVKSSNCLIDLSRGGKLLLTDFGSAVAPGEDSVGFSPVYASPELLQAHANDDYSGLEADKVDAFGLGCILFELLCCQKLFDLTEDQTLAEYIAENGVESALELPCVRLPWLPPAQDGSETASTCSSQVIGYSNALQGLVKTLLEPLPASRWTPSELQKPLRNDSLSPLVANYIVAAQPPIPGAPVTIDNVQLGMFVQRGQDWEEGDSDGGLGSIGVIVNLDSDALYTLVAWPLRTSQASSLESTMCCRIGASNKFELQVGPTPMTDFVTGTGEPRGTGILKNSIASNHSIGQLVNNNCMVVGVRDDLVLVAPLEQITIPTIPAMPVQPPAVPQLLPRKGSGTPENWQPNETSVLVEVVDFGEKSKVVDLFFSNRGGMDIQAFEITSIKRVQSIELWKVYAESREHVAAENWGVANERRLFHGTRTFSPATLLHDHTSEFYQKCSYGGMALDSRDIRFSPRASWGDENGHRQSNGERQIVLSRVALGRVRERSIDRPQSPQIMFHSEKKPSEFKGTQINVIAVRNPCQAVPEYIIGYRPLPGPSRRIVSARWPPAAYNRSSQGTTGRQHHRSTHRIQLNGATTGIHLQHGVAGLQITGQGRAFEVTRRNSTGTPKEAALQGSSEEQIKSSSTKMCVVCLSKPVCRILLPCGHPCLCEICSTDQGLTKLKRKCPECRSAIREAATIYGRIVDD
jgi:serine/threonine protein kinase